MSEKIKQITNKIIQIEQKHKLFDWKINNVFVWELIRHKIYQIALDQLEINSRLPSKISKKEVVIKIYSKFKQYLHAILNNPFFDNQKVEYLVFESSRKIQFNNDFIDPYTYFFQNELREKSISFCVLQSSYSYDLLAQNRKGIKHLDLLYFYSRFHSKNKFIEFSFKDKEELLRINEVINVTLGLTLNLSELISKEILQFEKQSKYFKKLLVNHLPQKIVMVNFCDKSALIYEAKKLNIEIIDIQHGLISSDDIIYHYPQVPKNSLAYFPTYFYTWDKIWSEICSIPIDLSNIVVYGNKYLEEKVKNYSNNTKKDNFLVVISQPGITNAIASFIIENHSYFDKFEVIYKLHPIEYSIRENNSLLNQLACKKNIHFAEKHEDLYQLFAKSRFVVGVYSTALLEAKTFDCSILLLNLPGVEMMLPFIDGNSIKMFEN